MAGYARRQRLRLSSRTRYFLDYQRGLYENLFVDAQLNTLILISRLTLI